MARKRNILKRSKTVENRVQRYLWPGTSRAWKEKWDIGSLNYEGEWECVGEVKSVKVGGLRDIWTHLSDALAQVEAVAPHEECWCFAVLLPPNTQIGDAFVMYRPWGLHGDERDYDGTRVILTLEQFSRIAFVREADDAAAVIEAQKSEIPVEVSNGSGAG